MKLWFIILFLIQLYGEACLGQTNFDSINNTLLHSTVEKQKVQALDQFLHEKANENYIKTLSIYEQLRDKYHPEKDDSLLGSINLVLASCNERLCHSSKAISFYFTAKEIGYKINSPGIQATATCGIGSVYLLNNDFEQCIFYYKEARKYYDGTYKESVEFKAANSSNIGYLNYMYATSLDTSNFDEKTKFKNLLRESIAYYKQAFSELNNDTLSDVFTNININTCLAYIDLGMVDSAKYFFNKVHDNIKFNNNYRNSVEQLYNEGKILFFAKAYSEALVSYKKSLSIALQTNYAQFVYTNYFAIYQCQQKLGNTAEALNYFKRYINHKDSLLNLKNAFEIEQIKANLTIVKKNHEIAILDNSISRKSFYNVMLFSILGGLMILGVSGYRNINIRQKLQKAKIVELEKEKQLLAVDAMLKGQEEERSRLAKDLHDGLGGMLSGVKLSFSNMKENLVMDNDNSIRFEKSISQLDGTIAELRKVAHNLMPEALVKFGLGAAIKDFCQSLTNPPQLNIIYQNPSPARVLDNTANVYVYRIVQELVNNAVKHSAANQILVQLSTNAEKAFITVEDNGKGMDKNPLQNSTGIGLSNIQKRVDYFKGSMEVDTNPGSGTSVNIELFV